MSKKVAGGFAYHGMELLSYSMSLDGDIASK